MFKIKEGVNMQVYQKNVMERFNNKTEEIKEQPKKEDFPIPLVVLGIFIVLLVLAKTFGFF